MPPRRTVLTLEETLDEAASAAAAGRRRSAEAGAERPPARARGPTVGSSSPDDISPPKSSGRTPVGISSACSMCACDPVARRPARSVGGVTEMALPAVDVLGATRDAAVREVVLPLLRTVPTLRRDEATLRADVTERWLRPVAGRDDIWNNLGSLSRANDSGCWDK